MIKYILGLITGIIVCNWLSVYHVSVQIINYFVGD